MTKKFFTDESLKTFVDETKSYVDSSVETTVRYTEQTLDEEQKVQARINIGVEYTEDDAIDLLAEMEVIDPVTDSDGAILTDENGNILSL